MEKDDIKKLKSGSKWTALGATAGVLTQLLIMLALALFLEPEDVGLFSVFLFVLGLSVTLLPLGNDFSFVQVNDLSSGDLRRAILLSVSIAVIVMALVIPLTNHFVDSNPSVANALGFGIAVGLAESIFLLCSAALQRDLNYKAIERANILRQISTLLLSILLLASFHRVEGAFVGRLIANALALVSLLPTALLQNSRLRRSSPLPH